jgi:diguanylate cyclase (GGDEF)-like protein
VNLNAVRIAHSPLRASAAPLQWSRSDARRSRALAARAGHASAGFTEVVLTVSAKTTLTTLVVVSLTFAVAGALLLRVVHRAAVAESRHQALLLGRMLAGSFAAPLSQRQHEMIQRQIDQIAESPVRYPDVLDIVVADDWGTIVAASDPTRYGDQWAGDQPLDEGLREDFSQPTPRILLRMPVQTSVRFGSLEVTLSVREPWLAAEVATHTIGISLLVGMIIVVVTLSRLLHRLVGRRVRRLAAEVARFPAERPRLTPLTDGSDEISLLARAFDEMSARLSDYTGGLEQKVDERTRELREARDALQHANQRLQALAVTDPLTGVGNRRAFSERLDLEVERSRRSRHPLSLILFDLDHFKQLNDRLGHLEGDMALVRLATLLTENRRAPDLVARYGGEEFTLLLPDTPHEDAMLVAERLRQAVERRGLSGCTVSAGVATLPDHAEDSRSLIAAADHAMYAAKGAGRNQVVSAGIPTDQPIAAVD